MTQVDTISSGLYPSLSAPNVLPFHRGNRYGLLNQAKEQFPTGPRCSSVKSKREFIQIIIQMRYPNSPLMCPLQPPLQQSRHSVHQRQKVSPDISGMTGNDMFITCGGQSFVTTPPVSANDTARFHALLHSWYQALCPCIKYPSKANTTNMVVFIFDCNKNQRLTCCTASPFPWPFTSDISFIYLHRTRQSITARAYHGSAKFMEPYPHCFVPLNPQNSLKSHGTDAILLVNYVPHRPEPQLEGFPRNLER